MAASLFEMPSNFRQDTQTGFAFPEPLTEKYRPRTFEESNNNVREALNRLQVEIMMA